MHADSRSPREGYPGISELTIRALERLRDGIRGEFWEIFAGPAGATIAANEQPLNRQSSNQH